VFVGDGALDPGVEVAVGGLTPVKSIAGKDLGGAHSPPLSDGVRRLTDVHHLSGIGHHHIDALLLGGGGVKVRVANGPAPYLLSLRFRVLFKRRWG